MTQCQATRAAVGVAICLGTAGLVALWLPGDDTFSALKDPPLTFPRRQSIRLLVIVPTARETHRAQYVRDAYAMMKRNPTFCDMSGDCPFQVRLIFVVGDPNAKTTSLTGDTLTVKAQDQDPDCRAASILVSSTTTKLLRALRWAATCGDCYDYVMRQGDDAHVNLHNLFDKLATAPHTKWVLGRYIKNGPVEFPWLIKFLMIRVYPPYPYGMGWVMSTDVAEAIAALRMPKLSYPEDAIFGIWLLGMDVMYEDTHAFHNRRDRNIGGKIYRDLCRPTDILTHYMLPGDWEEINPIDFTVTC